MQQIRFVARLSAVFFSMTLIAGYVAWQAGAFEQGSVPRVQPTETAQPSQYMPSSKFAALAAPGEHFVTQDGTAGVDVPPTTLPTDSFDLRAFSSKSSVPLVDPQRVEIPVELSDAAPKSSSTNSTPVHSGKTILPSTKRKVPLIEVPPRFPTQPNSRSGKAAIEPTPTEPPTTFSGSKSFVPLIEVPTTEVVPKNAPQTYKGKGG